MHYHCAWIDRPAAQPLHSRDVIYRDGHVVGYIRRAEYAHTLDTVIAWGYIKHHEGQTINKDYIMNGEEDTS